MWVSSMAVQGILSGAKLLRGLWALDRIFLHFMSAQSGASEKGLLPDRDCD
jgi:hypothetical protein